MADAASASAGDGAIDTALYDRQLRLWGEDGQLRLQKANVCLLGATATGTELLKNMVLPGVGRFSIVDGETTSAPDLGVNFFATDEDVGQPRAETTVKHLSELNETVKGQAVVRNPGELIAQADDSALAEFFGAFSLVVVADWSVTDDHVVKLGKFLYTRDTPLVIARVTGLVATVRLVVREHCVIEARVDNPPDDLRINNPWPELQAFTASIDLDSLNSADHGHVPYVVILIKAVEKWRAAHDGKLPSVDAEKDAFKASIKEMGDIYEEQNFEEALKAAVRAYMPYEIKDELKEVFQNPRCAPDQITGDSSDFWVLATAVKQYVADHDGVLPLPGAIPDMTADTQGYIALQKIYAAQAAQDREVYTKIVEELLTTRAKRPANSISEAHIQLFLSNVNVVRTVHFRALEEEFGQSASPPDDFPILFMVPDYKNVRVYWAVRACGEFLSKHGRFPGSESDKKDEEIAQLTEILQGLADKWGVSESLEEDDASKWAQEMWRYGGAELHPMASFIGGLASQEAIKIISGQFTPLDNTFVHNGVDATSMVLRA
jgi:NEDD8-activating enzyme E1 regulatory subunit